MKALGEEGVDGYDEAAKLALLEAAEKAVAATRRYVSRVPVGLVLVIAPWNYPLNMAAWKIGPALAAGNCVVVVVV